jgi:hypothetical protein
MYLAMVPLQIGDELNMTLNPGWARQNLDQMINNNHFSHGHTNDAAHLTGDYQRGDSSFAYNNPRRLMVRLSNAYISTCFFIPTSFTKVRI